MQHLVQHGLAGAKDLRQPQPYAGLARHQPHQQHHTDDAPGNSADGDPGDPELGQAEPAVEQQQVADEGDEVDDEGHVHGLTGVAMGAQGGGQTERRRFRQQAEADDLQIKGGIPHQVGGQVHQRQHGAGAGHDPDRGHQPHQQVEADGGVDDHARLLSIPCPQILGDHHAGTYADEAEQGDGEIEHLVADCQCRHPLIGDMAHHEGVEGPGQEVQGEIDEQWPGQGEEGARARVGLSLHGMSKYWGWPSSAPSGRAFNTKRVRGAILP